MSLKNNRLKQTDITSLQISHNTCEIPFWYNPSLNMDKIFQSVDSPGLNGLKSERHKILIFFGVPTYIVCKR